MAKKSEKTETFDKKTLDKLKKQLVDEFDKEYRDKMVKDLSDEVYKDVQKNFDDEYKKQLTSTVTDEILSDVKEKVNKQERRLSARKSFKIFRLSVYIIVLLAVIIYVIYRLYSTGNLGIVKYNYHPTTNQGGNEVVTTTTQAVDYKELYGYLVDTVKIYDETLYKGSYKVTDLTLNQRLAIAYSTISKDDIEVDGTINVLRATLLKNAYTKLFGLDDFETIPFTVKNLGYIYSNNKNEFIAIQYEEYNKDVKYELLDVSIDDENIYVKAIAAKVMYNKVYNISGNTEICSIDDNLSGYKDKLNVITLTFGKDKKLKEFATE